jgi:hypothetical protein
MEVILCYREFDKFDICVLQACPLCKTVIRENIRYSNIIKPQYAAVCEVKEKVFGKMNLLERSRNQLIEKLSEMHCQG